MDITIGNWTATVDPMRSPSLPEMETKYLLCVANGMTHKEAGRELDRSHETVGKSLKRAYHRLGAKNGKEAVAVAVSLRVIRRATKTLACALLAIALSVGSDDALRRGGRTYRLSRRETEVQIYA